MRWPFNRRTDPVHAWGTLTLAVGVAGVIATELATLHANEAAFRWWWPTNWMAVPATIFGVGLLLLLVPLRRSSPTPAEDQRGFPEQHQVTGEEKASTEEAKPKIAPRISDKTAVFDSRVPVALDSKRASIERVFNSNESVRDTLPRRNRAFTGREVTLEKIERSLNSGPVVVLAVRGLGGVGKSQVALEYAHRMLERGKYSLVGWIRADSPVRIAGDLAALAPSLDLIPEGPPGMVANEVIRVLGSRSDWLLVFDNAKAPHDVEEMLPASEGHVLITSRNRLWSGIASPLDLREFDRDESVRFLQDMSRRAEPEAADELAAELGDLPLALAQAASYIDTYDVMISKYLTLYRKPEIGRQMRAKELTSDEYDTSVASTWVLHFDTLRQERPAAVELLRLCAYLDPNEIDLDILTAEAGQLSDALVPVITDQFERTETVGALARASLITMLPSGRLRIHRLVQAVTRDQLDEDQEKAWSKKVFNVIRAAFPASPQEPAVWPVCAALAPHVEAVLNHVESYPELIKSRGELVGYLAVYLTATAQYSTAVGFQEHALAIKRASCGPNHPEVARALGNLGVILRNMGDLKAARSCQERALAIEEAHYGPDHPTVARTLSNLGNIQRDLGDLQAALGSQKRSLMIEEEACGPTHPDVAKTLGNLGIIQQDLGNLDAALHSQERALAITEDAFGLDHPEVARTLVNLGIIQQVSGNREAARNSLERALAIAEDAYGPDHADTVKVLSPLCLVQRHLGDIQAALGTQERILAFKEATYGLYHPEVAKALGNLGFLQRMSNEEEASRHSFERALEVFRSTYGPDHPDTQRAARQVSQ